MKVIQIDGNMVDRLAPLVADFRVTLQSFRGVCSDPDVKAGKMELEEYLNKGYPVYASEDGDVFTGYVVCRVEDGCLWVEQLFVRSDCRRKGIASKLFEKAEELAREMGEETVFNYVHPNNDAVIQFLRSKGYTVLNLIEIRKAYTGEPLSMTIDLNGHTFDY